MAHIHFEDGTFPIQWAIVWLILTVVALSICLFWLRKVKRADNRMITLAGLCTAAAFAIFQVNIPVFGGVHLNLTPLIGILSGPALGGIIILVVNIFSAGIGHGGWGLIGANCLVNLAEVFTTYLLYRWLGKLNLDVFSKAGISTLLGLFLGNVVMVLIILVSGIQGVGQGTTNLLYGMSLVVGVNMGVAVIEAIITGYIVSYISRVRPDILQEAVPFAKIRQ